MHGIKYFGTEFDISVSIWKNSTIGIGGIKPSRICDQRQRFDDSLTPVSYSNISSIYYPCLEFSTTETKVSFEDSLCSELEKS
jgi:hypothetical protein